MVLTMASGFRTIMAAKLGTVGELSYVYLWDKLLQPVVLNCLKLLAVELTVRSSC